MAVLGADPALDDYHLADNDVHIVDQALDWHSLSLPAGDGLPQLAVLCQYELPLWLSLRPEVGAQDIGAYAYSTGLP